MARAAHGRGMTFEVEIPVQPVAGTDLDIGRLTRQWQETCRRHVRTRSILRRGQWIPGPPAEPVVATAASATPEQVDPAGGRGAVLTIIPTDDGRWRLVWRFSHAVCDGYGAGRIILECLRRYNRPERREEKEPSEKIAEPSVTSPAAVVPPDLRHLAMTVRGRNVRLGPLGRPADSIDSGNVLHWRIGDDQSQELRDRVRRAAIPLNDIAVAAAFRSIAAVVDSPAAHHVMILNPTQTRSWSRRWRSDNHLGMVLPRRRIDQLGSWEQIYGSVIQQLADVRRHGYDRDLPAGLAMVSRLPGAMWSIDRMGVFTPTASVTCLSGFNLRRQGGFGKTLAGQIQPAYPIQSSMSNPPPPAGTLRPLPMTVTGPIQCGGSLSIAVWDEGLQIAASFRFADPSLRPIIQEIQRAWDHTFEQLLRGVWSLNP